MTIKLRASGWELGGEHLPWIWGQINYWDIERSHWHDVLRSYHQAGHAVVATAAVPRIHQNGPGQYDFGKLRPGHDLAAFLAEAREVGLKVVLWAGPRPLPGVGGAGYPEELLADENALARSAEGELIPSAVGYGGEVFSLPSLVTDRLVQSLKPFAEGLLAAIGNQVHPDGPLIGLGLTQAPGWLPGLAAFSADYHPEAIALYQTFLRKRYTRIAALNTAYTASYKSFFDVQPPRAMNAPDQFPGPWLMDWAAFREDYFVQSAERLVALFSDLAQKRIPIFLETIPSVGRPNNLAELDHMRCFAYAMTEWPLPGKSGLGQALALAQPARFLSWFKTPLAREDRENHLFELSKSIAYGIRAWEALSPSGSGRFPGFVTDRQGSLVRPHHPLWENIQEVSRTEGLLHSQLYAEVVLLTLPEYERAEYLETPAASRMDLLGMPQTQPEPALDPVTRIYHELYAQLDGFLTLQRFPFLKAEGDASPDRLERFPLIVVPGMPEMSAGMQHTLADLVEEGVSVLIVGSMPRHPEGAKHVSLAELLEIKPKKGKGAAAKKAKKGRLYHLEDAGEQKMLRLFQQIGIQRPVIVDAPGIEVTFHKYRSRFFIAAVNHTAEPVETVVRRDGKFVLKDFWNNNKFWGGNNEIKVQLPPRSVKYWELIEC